MTARATPRPARSRRRQSLGALTLAVTGATGTVGPRLLARLGAEPDVGKILVLTRRRLDLPHSTAPIELRRLDVRDAAAAAHAVRGADVVVHLAFALHGVASSESALFRTNVEGTLNMARAAARVGARRFLYTSSAIVYGFSPERRQPLDESAPIRASGGHFYGRHKAQAELLVEQELANGDTGAYVFRPCAIVGPNAVGGALSAVPTAAVRAARVALAVGGRVGLRPVVPAPPVPLQFVHEDDVAQALVRATLGRGPTGPYNLAGEGVLDGSEAVRLLGFRELPLPRPIVRGGVRALASAPPVIPALGWSEVGTAPLILATDKARSRLGWQPRYTSPEALLDTRRALGW